MQYDRPDLVEGLVLAFRHRESSEETKRLHFHGLDATARYEVRSENTGETQLVRGQELRDGYAVTLSQMPGSELITYRKENEGMS